MSLAHHHHRSPVMNLLVGHTCPGCGLDSSELFCAACDGVVVCDPHQGAHCRACGKPVPSITCVECGRESDL